MSERLLTAGGCLCGALRDEARGEPLHVGYCHCRSCRHHTGAPVAAMLVFRADRVRFPAGERRRYRSSPEALRGFCARCGTPLSYESHTTADEVHVYVSTIDDPDAFPATAHVFARERIAWFDVADDLTRHPGSSLEGE